MNPQLYMYEPMRKDFIKKHDFYLQQIQNRILTQFKNIDAEADAYAESSYNELASQPYYGEEDDISAIAEQSYDMSIDFHMLLTEIHDQVILSSIAGLFHQWDKELRDFLSRELRDAYTQDCIKRSVWKSNFNDIFSLLKEFGWDCEKEEFFKTLNTFRLLINVYKHGNGDSLDALVKDAPHYLRTFGDPPFIYFHYDMIIINESDIAKLANAIRIFWEKIPERLFLISSNSSKLTPAACHANEPTPPQSG